MPTALVLKLGMIFEFGYSGANTIKTIIVIKFFLARNEGPKTQNQVGQ